MEFELKGWKARVVLAAALIQVISSSLVALVAITSLFIH